MMHLMHPHACDEASHLDHASGWRALAAAGEDDRASSTRNGILQDAHVLLLTVSWSKAPALCGVLSATSTVARATWCVCHPVHSFLSQSQGCCRIDRCHLYRM